MIQKLSVGAAMCEVNVPVDPIIHDASWDWLPCAHYVDVLACETVLRSSVRSDAGNILLPIHASLNVIGVCSFRKAPNCIVKNTEPFHAVVLSVISWPVDVTAWAVALGWIPRGIDLDREGCEFSIVEGLLCSDCCVLEPDAARADGDVSYANPLRAIELVIWERVAEEDCLMNYEATLSG